MVEFFVLIHYICLSKVAVRYKKKLIKRYVSRAATSKAYLFIFMEVWKDVVNYDGFYQVSSLGNVKSLKHGKCRILKHGKTHGGYLGVTLCINGKGKSKKIHKLVAEAFLEHTPCGYELVINHKNFDRTDNRADNLEIVTARENTNKKHLKSTSKHTGIYWRKDISKWRAHIGLNGKLKHLGYFKNELDASNAYQKALKEHLLK